MDLLPHFDNMGVVWVMKTQIFALPIEQDFSSTINGFTGQNDTEVSSNSRGKSSQEKEIRVFNTENRIPNQGRLWNQWNISQIE